jgi:hypothetical protein
MRRSPPPLPFSAGLVIGFGGIALEDMYNKYSVVQKT